MIRKIIGWVRIIDEPWEDTMHRMKERVNRGLRQHPVKWWTQRLGTYLWQFAVRVKASLPDSWIVQSSEWEPNLIEDASCEYHPYRRVGRPYLKWDDVLNRFCGSYFNSRWQEVPIASFNECLVQFVEFYNEGVHVDPPVVIDAPIIIDPLAPFFHPSTDAWW